MSHPHGFPNPSLPSRAAGLAAVALALLLGCGGSRGAGTSGLAYTDPTASGFRLVRNTALSTPAHLVLDLMGPTDGLARGVAFTLDAGSAPVAWAPVQPDDGRYAQNAAFDLGADPQIFVTQVQGSQLSVILYEKRPGNAKPLGGSLCRVALDAQAPALSAAPLAVTQFRVLPETGADLVAAPCAAGTVTSN